MPRGGKTISTIKGKYSATFIANCNHVVMVIVKAGLYDQ